MATQATKSLFASKTIWGLIAVVVPYVETAYSYLSALPPEFVLPQPISLGIQGLGLLLAFYGRIKATATIK